MLSKENVRPIVTPEDQHFYEVRVVFEAASIIKEAGMDEEQFLHCLTHTPGFPVTSAAQAIEAFFYDRATRMLPAQFAGYQWAHLLRTLAQSANRELAAVLVGQAIRAGLRAGIPVSAWQRHFKPGERTPIRQWLTWHRLAQAYTVADGSSTADRSPLIRAIRIIGGHYSVVR